LKRYIPFYEKWKPEKCLYIYTDDGCFYVGLNRDGQTTKMFTTKRSLPQAHKPFQCCPANMQTLTENDSKSVENGKNKRFKIGRKEISEINKPKVDYSDKKNIKNVEKIQSKTKLLNTATNKIDNSLKPNKNKNKGNHEKSIFEIKNYIWW
jgi:hypothetical protein